MDRASLAQEIKTRVVLSSVVRSAVQLKGRGDSLLGLCPFHEEKTPSFHVRDKVARYKCFGCGASGDVIEFVMRLRGLSFPEALDELADRVGIKKVLKPLARPNQNVVNVLAAQKIAQEFFLNELTNSPQGQKARRYLLKDRGLSENMLRQAGLGFASLSTKDFVAHLKKRGVSGKIAHEAGLVKTVNGSLQGQFNGRITLPIRNVDGDIIAFGGRNFLCDDKDAPKYVNTHSYADYEKRKHFYGLYESKAAILKGIPPIIVEGYFDAMAMWALGVPALALCGTALSLEHITSLRRLTTRIWLCFDNDDAGLMALNRAVLDLVKHSVMPELVLLMEKDPGDYLAHDDLNTLKAAVAKPIDALSYLIERAGLFAKTNVLERLKQIDRLLPIFANIKRPLIRRQYVAHLAKTLHEDPLLLWLDIEKKSKSIKQPSSTRKVDEMIESVSFNPHERLLIEIALADASLFSQMEELVKECSRHTQRLLELISRAQASGDHEGLKSLVETVEPKLWGALENIVINRIALSKEEATASLSALKKKMAGRRKKEELKRKREEAREFERIGDFSSVLRSLKEQSDLLMADKNATNFPGQPRQKLSENNASHHNETKKIHTINDLNNETFFDETEDWL